MNSSSSVVCREIFDENSQPSADEITEYAQTLGIDTSSENHLLPIAKDGLMQALPQPWRAYYDEKLQTHYYYNTDTKETQWDHPLDNIYKDLVSKARAAERDHSMHDDTYASVQDLLTSEEVSKHFVTGKNYVNREIEDEYSTDGSLEEKNSKRKYKPNHNLQPFSGQKADVLTPIEKKPPRILSPIHKRTNMKLGDLKVSPWRKSVDSSLTFKESVFSKNTKIEDSKTPSKDSEANKIINNSFDSTETVNDKSGIIDLSMNLSQKVTDIVVPLQLIKSEKGLLFSGEGSMFLKSRNGDDNAQVPREVARDSQPAEPPRSILREKILDLSEKVKPAATLAQQPQLVDHRLGSMDTLDDKKSVRFNLEHKEIDIHFDFSQSTCSNPSSDLGLERRSSDISLGVNKKTMGTGKLTSENSLEKTSNDEKLSSLPPKPNLNVRLSPITALTAAHTGAECHKDLKSRNWPYQDDVDSEDKMDSSQFSSTDKTDSKSPSSSGNKRLLKPPAADFIKPNLFQKQFDKIVDIIKPITIDTDSDSEFKPRPSSPMNSQKNKISIHLMESIESETPSDSDKEFSNIDLNAENNPRKCDDLKNRDNQLIEFQDQILISKNEVDKYRVLRLAELEKAVHEEIVQLAEQLQNKKKAEEKELRESMNQDIKKIIEGLQQEKDAAIEKLRKELEVVHNNNRNELEKEITTAKTQHENNTLEIIKGIQVQLLCECEDAIRQQRNKYEDETKNILEELEKERCRELQQLRNSKSEELQKDKQKLEQENKKAMSEMLDIVGLELQQLEEQRREAQCQHRQQLDEMRSQHQAVCDDLRRDYRNEVELLRSQHLGHLSQLKERLEAERRRARDTEENSYDKLENEKRQLEDKYRCLKEKYIRLKTDIKVSLERRNRRREQSLTTGSETERSNSKKIGQTDKLKKGDPSTTTSVKPHLIPANRANNVIKRQHENETSQSVSCRSNDNNTASQAVAEISSESRADYLTNKTHSRHLTVQSKDGNRSSDRSRSKSPIIFEKLPTGKLVSCNNEEYKNDTNNEISVTINDTSMSQSECSVTTSKGKSTQLPGGFGRDAVSHKKKDSSKKYTTPKITMIHREKAMTDYHESSDTANDTTDRKSEDNYGRSRKKAFNRLKSASTSRLNYSQKHGERSCSPVENLKQQLRKLEELEEQFPDLTLNVDNVGYRLTYPFADSGDGIERCTSAPAPELGFVAHRALVERERVRRARAVLRRHRTALRERRRAASAAATCITPHPHHAWQEDRELTDLEVSLHRTRAMLGEKVIRLRHIEKTLRNMTTSSSNDTPPDKAGKVAQVKMRKDKHDVTLSDISSQSSGFSSNEVMSDCNMQQLMKREIGPPGVVIYEQSDEIISSLENLNTEIRDIWKVLNVQQTHNLTRGLLAGQMFCEDLSSLIPSAVGEEAVIPSVTVQPTPGVVQHVPGVVQHIPTLSDRLRTYRQLVSDKRPVGMSSAVVTARTRDFKNEAAATSLVERTEDLREWLKQQTSL